MLMESSWCGALGEADRTATQGAACTAERSFATEVSGEGDGGIILLRIGVTLVVELFHSSSLNPLLIL